MSHDEIEKKYSKYKESIYAPLTQNLLERLERAIDHQTVYGGKETINDAIVYIRDHFHYGLYS